jgi:hypothetical protein
MKHVKSDRVKETTSTTGTGALTLDGAPTGYHSLASEMSVGDTGEFCATGGNSGEWEVFIGTLTATNVLTRTTVIRSSNSNALVNFSAGSKEVFMTISSYTLNNTKVDLSSATSDYTLSLGEEAVITYTAQTSIPLHIATVPGVYRLEIFGIPASTVNGDGNILLLPNNTTMTISSLHSDYYDSNRPSPGTVSLTGFSLGAQNIKKSSHDIFTTTANKFSTGKSFARHSSVGMYVQESHSTTTDTTTAWTSLGTVVFVGAHSGSIVVKRIM